MNDLKLLDLKMIDTLFGYTSGHVLEFTNATFSAFFKSEIGIDINDIRYENGTNSKGKRFAKFLEVAPNDQVAQALIALWHIREFERQQRGEAETVKNACTRLSEIIVKLNGTALNCPTRSTEPKAEHFEIDYDGHKANLSKILRFAPQPRGYEFEKFLTSLFGTAGLNPQGAFRLNGEQIDGSFVLHNEIYLLEAKWQNQETSPKDLRDFQGKLDERADFARGLFISYSGFTSASLTEVTPRKFIMMNGEDIWYALDKQICFKELLDKKLRKLVESKNGFVRAAELF